ncbi:glucosamine-6-phosphate deaminase [Candidatus Sulfidibacterium hydrothermale]|uniref:glucosamine-6-phosphate deaminase n=1 Tax=Candidatus Sulfidibacterium hydrothermale TaxID=2875962 RepID=UPI001F0A0E80|nr:glucosamine-6-phosphate deaminase [Candidatus Sulfidibacterium hydrothermale]UBM62512.1 glucosamine-6-phosphate deaminase [Candidatus Sulfidibacterium hydrothermale]
MMNEKKLEVKERLERKYEKLFTEVYETPELGSKKTAEIIADLIREKNKNGETCVLGLATGSSPIGVYRELVRMHKEEGLSFKNVITFNLDEYYPMPKEHVQSYWYFMHEHLFDHIDILPENIHIPDGTIPENKVFDFCQDYENAIQEAGGIDLQILGIGRTGHIGFNEPGSGMDSPTRMVTLDSLTIADAAGDFQSEENVPRKAITMGVGTIMTARRIILLAWGEKKAAIIQKAIEGPVLDSVPATYLQKHPDTVIVLDKEAAAELTRFKTPWLVRQVTWNDKLIRKATLWLCDKLNKPILKLTNRDYNDNSLGDLVVKNGPAYDINLKVFNMLQKSITGWPGGKPNADDTQRPERALPYPKRVLVFSPHPDDDMLAMGGTINRLVEQGHEVYVAYQTSGNIAVADDVVIRFLYVAENIAKEHAIDARKVYRAIENKKQGDIDIPEVRQLKTLIREAEARSACHFLNIPDDHIFFLKMPFYETGTIKKASLGQKDVDLMVEAMRKVKPHQIYTAGDLTDPHGTHRKCFNSLVQALEKIKTDNWLNECRIWLYHGTWKEWEIADVDMAVPVSPEELKKKRSAIFRHSSQKEMMFPGSEDVEIWRYAIERNRETAKKYDRFGMAEYEAIELFVEYVLNR